MKYIIIILSIVLFPFTCFGEHQYLEKYYQTKWCSEQNGKMEVTLEGGGRVDCVTSTHVIEVEFAEKWAEAIGQSLYYSLSTNRKSGIVLIIESEKDMKFLLRLNSTIEHFKLPIDVWKIVP